MSRLFLGLLVALVVALSAASASPAAAPKRIVSLSPTATESLFAIGAGKQVVAVDDQSDYPKEAPRTTLVGLHAERRGDRGLQAGPRRHLLRPERARRHAARARYPRPHPGRGEDARRRVRADQAARHAHRPREPGDRARHRMKTRIAELVAAGTKRARGLTVYHELGPDLYSVTSSTFAGRVYALFGLKNIADAADTGGSGYPKLSPSTSSRRAPTSSSSPTSPAAASRRGRSRRGRGGATSPRSRRARSSASTTRSRRAGGRGSSTSSAPSRRRSRI